MCLNLDPLPPNQSGHLFSVPNLDVCPHNKILAKQHLVHVSMSGVV